MIEVTDLASRTVNYGDVPTWIAAVATVLALGAAGFAAWASWNVLKRETQRDADRDADQRRQQANLVAAWRGVVPVYLNAVDGTLDSTIGTYGPVVRNASELPIYQVNVEIIPIGVTGGEHVPVYEVVPPGQWFVRVEDRGFYATRSVVLHPDFKDVAEYQVAVSFRDAAGNVWRRDVNGNLRQTGTVNFAEIAVTLPALTGGVVGGSNQSTGWRHRWFPRRKAPPS